MELCVSLDMEGMAGIRQPVQQTEDRATFRDALHMQLGWLIEGTQRSERNGEGANLVHSQVSAMCLSTGLSPRYGTSWSMGHWES